MFYIQEFCVDVSTYQPVIWVERDGQVGFSDIFQHFIIEIEF